MKKAKLSPESIRDTEWQRKEYERLMGEEAAERQEREANLAAGRCVCRSRVIKTDFGFRRIHDRDCTKFSPWMEEHIVDTSRGSHYTQPTTVPARDDGSHPREETS